MKRSATIVTVVLILAVVFAPMAVYAAPAQKEEAKAEQKLVELSDTLTKVLPPALEALRNLEIVLNALQKDNDGTGKDAAAGLSSQATVQLSKLEQNVGKALVIAVEAIEIIQYLKGKSQNIQQLMKEK